MKQIRKRVAILGLAAACWGIMFPEYVFTPDSYAVVCEDAGASRDLWETGRDSWEAGGQTGPREEEQISPREFRQAAGQGRVRYRLKLYEYLKKYVLSSVGGSIYE